MIANFNIEEFAKKIDEEVAEDILNVIGAQGVTWAEESLIRGYSKDNNYRTKNLANSLAYSTHKTQSPMRGQTSGETLDLANEKTVRIGTNVIYGAMHEFGGTITANKADALTIPISDEAKQASADGKGARSFPDLVLIHTKESPNPFLVRMNSDKKTFKIMYMLVKSVQQPARPYLRPVIEEHSQDILRIVQQAING